jgi:hypothetical protein
MPERLLAGEATEFERRVLEAARRKQPSPAASARMARALGVTAGVAAAATAEAAAAVGTKQAAAAATVKAATAAGATAVWPWVSAGVLGLVVAGAVVATRPWRPAPPEAAPPPARLLAAPPPPAPGPTSPPAAEPAAEVVAAAPARAPAAPIHRARVGAAGAGDVREEIALLDAARGALSAGADRRALEILRRYDDKYPAGSLRPEATAIEIEALLKGGRQAEARALATRFVAEHRGSLLAKRVAELAGLAAPAAAP